MSDYERLRQLLLGDAEARLAAHARRLEAIERAHADIARQLPELLRESQQQGHTATLSAALAVPVANALGSAVRDQPQTIVDALFPVIGPAIRKAIAEALRDFSEGFNRALESSLSPRGLRWRFEAWRSGSSYADVVLRHSLSFRIDHLFLMQRDSGLLLLHRSAADLAQPDGDAIAGMLTAIGDFVRDSVAGDAGLRSEATLGAASVGEHLLWLIEGPRANLAVFLRGVPPASLRALLAERLEHWHAETIPAPGEPSSGPLSPHSDSAQSWDLSALQRAAHRQDPTSSRPAKRRWPLLLVAIVVLLGLGAWLWRGWMWHQHMTAIEQRLRDWPGLHLDRVESPQVGEVHIRGLLDPLAEAPGPALTEMLPLRSIVQMDLRGFVSTDPPLLLRRAEKILLPPASVRLEIREGRLLVRGEADAQWIAQIAERATRVAGIVDVDSSDLSVTPDPRPGMQAELAVLVRRLDGASVEFSRDLIPDNGAAVESILRDALRATALAAQLGSRLTLVCDGYHDPTGSVAANQRLPAERADWLCAALQRGGVPSDALRAASEAEAAQSVLASGRTARLRAMVIKGARHD
ncbi:MAG: hypothetical protein ABI411_01160 [Tahibacter sp.]